MRRITTLLLTLSLGLFLGCSKDKKKTTPTDPVATSGGGADTDPAVQTTDNDMGGGGAKDPSLQQVVYFEFDSSDLDDSARQKLGENAEWLKADKSRTLTIEGHTDEVGTTEYNAALGERRAGAARDYLLRMGIDKTRVQIITYGEEKPASKEDALNRRSVFIATKK